MIKQEGVLTMLSIELPADVEERLDNLARRTGRSKEDYVRQAIIEFLHDREDVLLAIASLEKEDPGLLEEIKRELDKKDDKKH